MWPFPVCPLNHSISVVSGIGLSLWVKLFIKNIIKAHQKQWLFQTEQPDCFIKVRFQNERAIHIEERKVLLACWLTWGCRRPVSDIVKNRTGPFLLSPIPRSKLSLPCFPASCHFNKHKVRCLQVTWVYTMSYKEYVILHCSFLHMLWKVFLFREHFLPC